MLASLPPLFIMSTTANNTNLSQILGVTHLEIYAMKLISHGNEAWQILKEELIGSLIKKGFVFRINEAATPKLTTSGHTLMNALHY